MKNHWKLLFMLTSLLIVNESYAASWWELQEREKVVSLGIKAIKQCENPQDKRCVEMRKSIEEFLDLYVISSNSFQTKTKENAEYSYIERFIMREKLPKLNLDKIFRELFDIDFLKKYFAFHVQNPDQYIPFDEYVSQKLVKIVPYYKKEEQEVLLPNIQEMQDAFEKARQREVEVFRNELQEIETD